MIDSARLEGIALFAGLDDEQRAAVAARVNELVVESGDTLAVQGENAYELFVIEEGEAEVRPRRRADRDRREGDVCRRAIPEPGDGHVGDRHPVSG